MIFIYNELSRIISLLSKYYLKYQLFIKMSSIKIHLDNIMFQLKKLIKKKKVAIGFYGITRSLKYTIDSIKTNIFDVFTKNNMDYDVFLHTYFLNNYSNKRAKETITTNIDNNEYKLLNPKYFNQDDQDEIKKKITIRII